MSTSSPPFAASSRISHHACLSLHLITHKPRPTHRQHTKHPPLHRPLDTTVCEQGAGLGRPDSQTKLHPSSPVIIIIITHNAASPPTHLYTIHTHSPSHEASDVLAAAVHVVLHGAAARPALCLLQGQPKTQATARTRGASQAAHGRGGSPGGRDRGMRVRRPPPPPPGRPSPVQGRARPPVVVAAKGRPHCFFSRPGRDGVPLDSSARKQTTGILLEIIGQLHKEISRVLRA